MDDKGFLPSRRQRRLLEAAGLEVAAAGVCFDTQISVPSRLQRNKEANRRFYQELVAGVIFFIAILYVLLTDFSHLDRHWLPIVTGIAALCYTGLALWCLVRMVRMITLPRLAFGWGALQLPRQTSSENLLIKRPHLKGFFRLLLEAMLSLFVWGGFIYLFQPLSTALLWLFTGEWLWSFMFSAEAVYGTLDMLFKAGIFAICMFLVFFGWAQWNLYHYGGLDRRKPPLPVSDEQVAQNFGVSPDTVKRLKEARVAAINPTEAGPVFTIKEKISAAA